MMGSRITRLLTGEDADMWCVCFDPYVEKRREQILDKAMRDGQEDGGGKAERSSIKNGTWLYGMKVDGTRTVRSVDVGSLAHQAGLRVGDLLERVGQRSPFDTSLQQQTTSSISLRSLNKENDYHQSDHDLDGSTSSTPQHDTLTVDFIRGGVQMETELTLAKF
ncbi:unnamed protein product [Amoebophrya sp. A25]|nr:unnamed protein product [Amoebophrya sp. A25]|eukprot:GSA25T00005764001.1